MLGREPDPSVARSTVAYYEQRLKAWHRHLLGPFAIAVVLGILFAYPFWRWAPHGSFFAGQVVGGYAGMMAWVWDDPPHVISKWYAGIQGERKTARILKRLEGAGWYATHDRTTGRGNLDHIAVSRQGVFLLESKNLSGVISVEEDGLTAVYGDPSIDSFTNRRLVGSLRAAAATLKTRIAEATRLTYFVRIVVVIWGDFPAGLIEQHGVTYVAGSRLHRWLEEQPVRLSERDASLIRLALNADAVVPPAEPFGSVSA